MPLICRIAKAMVMGIKPISLKLTQKSVEKFRQIT